MGDISLQNDYLCCYHCTSQGKWLLNYVQLLQISSHLLSRAYNSFHTSGTFTVKHLWHCDTVKDINMNDEQAKENVKTTVYTLIMIRAQVVDECHYM